MRTVGQAVYMYANANKGMIPPSSIEDVQQIVAGVNPQYASRWVPALPQSFENLSSKACFLACSALSLE